MTDEYRGWYRFMFWVWAILSVWNSATHAWLLWSVCLLASAWYARKAWA